MANYFTLEYENTTASSPGSIELNYGSSTSDGLTIQASLYAGEGFTPTYYKMWGVGLVSGGDIVTASGAVWLPFVSSRSITLAAHNNPQTAFVKFKDNSDNETDTFQSNAVTFDFIDPIIHISTEWEQKFSDIGYGTTTSNSLINNKFGTKVDLNKSKVDQLLFSGRNFSGLELSENTIYINSSSDIGRLIALDSNNHVTITKVFDSDDTPIITVDDGNGFFSLTTFNHAIKTTASGLNSDRIKNSSWSAANKTLSFDAYRFSTYGFTTIQKVEFSADSQTAAYVGSTATFKVYVQDGNGEGVEGAPVTVSGISGDIGTLQESMPVNTDEYGFAEFNLNVTATGQMDFEATVDNKYTADKSLLINGVAVPDSQRSLLTQYEQIRRSATYDDNVSLVNDSNIAEPTSLTISGSLDSVLEYDLNILRTLIKQLKGTSNWFDSNPKYFDPTNTDALDTYNSSVSLNNMAGNTLDAKTAILSVDGSNFGSGFSVSPGDGGFLFNTTLPYATASDRRGLPIFNTTNSGTYYDEGSLERVVEISILDMSNNSEYTSDIGDTVYAKFHDGADFGGSGDGTDVYVKLYTSNGPYTVVSGSPTLLTMVFPYRKVLSEMEEYEWLRTDFVNSWEGNSIIVDEISGLWSYIGASNNEVNPNWTVISGSPMVNNLNGSIHSAIDAFNDEFGSRIFTENNYITSGQSFTDSLDVIDKNIHTLYQAASDKIADKYIEVLDTDIGTLTAHLIPDGLSYTPNSTEGQEGSNMDVYINGQLLSACTGLNGINKDKDYMEIDSNHISFTSKIHKYTNITYMIRE